MSNNVEFFICMEETMTAPVTRLEEKKTSTGIRYIDFEACLQSFGKLNRNKGIYVKELMMQSINNGENVQELLKKNAWCGEAGHPLTTDTTRILTIDPKLISHKMSDPKFVGDLLTSRVTTLTNQLGTEMMNHILQGLDPSFSLRGICPRVATPKGKIQSKPAHVVTYDWVIFPSHKEAYKLEGGINKHTSLALESTNVYNMESLNDIALESCDLFDQIISAHSKNIKLVSNVLEEDMKSVRLAKGGNFIVSESAIGEIYTPVDKGLKKIVRGYMGRI